MKEYSRDIPQFSLCGLNCGLCPRYHTKGTSRCPGCGGAGFHLAHPSCAVITCSNKHGNVEFCCHCADYPCDRYKTLGTKDSFITYQNVIKNFQRVLDDGLDRYQTELEEKIGFLEELLHHYDDGRRKSFYCTAVNLLDLSDLQTVKARIENEIALAAIPLKEKSERITALFHEQAKRKNIILGLRK